MINNITRMAGIDAGKDRLDVAIHGGADPFTVDNTPTGWPFVAARLREAGIEPVGIEASGSDERGVARHLQAAGFTGVVLQPLQVRAIAKLHLRRAKSERIDAVLIAACTHVLDPKEARVADCGARFTPPPCPPPSAGTPVSTPSTDASPNAANRTR